MRWPQVGLEAWPGRLCSLPELLGVPEQSKQTINFISHSSRRSTLLLSRLFFPPGWAGPAFALHHTPGLFSGFLPSPLAFQGLYLDRGLQVEKQATRGPPGLGNSPAPLRGGELDLAPQINWHFVRPKPVMGKNHLME